MPSLLHIQSSAYGHKAVLTATRQQLAPHCQRLWKHKLFACPFSGILNSSSHEHFPFKPFPTGKPYKLLLGLRQPQDPWLDVDEDDEVLLDQLRQKAKHIEERRDAVIQTVNEPLARDAARELLEQLLAELPHRHPTRYRVEGSAITNLLTGETFRTADPGVNPLEVAGRLTQEDYCLLAPGDGEYRLVGGVVCFPSHWSILEKLGMGLPQVHDPVPRWRRDLAQPAQSFLSRLAEGRPFSCWNWTLSASAELHLSKFYTPPPPPASGDAAPHDDPTDVGSLQLRLERQYFHRLPRSGCVVFTIRTYMQPLGRALAGRQAAAAALAGALRDLPYEHLQYKSNLQRRLPDLLAFLEGRAARGGTEGSKAKVPASVAQGE